MADPRFLLDTNICIHLIEGLSDVARRRVEVNASGTVVTSVIAYAEVMRGADLASARARRVTDAFFDACPVLSFDAQAALAFRTVPFKRGKFDHLIAAHALALDLTLITANPRDFAEIPGLRVEDWSR